jgi:precorrin-6A/cobalt-precorrin-6A reductase
MRNVTVRVLLLGGTGEARRLAGATLGWPQLELVTSLAGRVKDPLLPAGEVRIGGFGGSSGLAGWLRAQQVRAVVDATHPFASAITAQAAAAAGELELPFVVLRRPGWQPGPGDVWHWADSMDAAARLLPELGSRAFLTVGRTGLAAFGALDRMWFLVRTIDAAPALPANCEVLLDRGPFTVDGELELLRRHRIDVLVSKDSGGDMTAAKLVAARRLGVPAVLVRRPALPEVPVVHTEEDALAWLRALLPGCRDL